MQNVAIECYVDAFSFLNLREASAHRFWWIVWVFPNRKGGWGIFDSKHLCIFGGIFRRKKRQIISKIRRGAGGQPLFGKTQKLHSNLWAEASLSRAHKRQSSVSIDIPQMDSDFLFLLMMFDRTPTRIYFAWVYFFFHSFLGLNRSTVSTSISLISCPLLQPACWLPGWILPGWPS